MLLFFVIFLWHISPGLNFNITDIVKESKEAIILNDLDKNIAVLRKRYFTDKKVDSIWWWARKIHYETFNLEIGYEQLIGFEKGIQRIVAQFNRCENDEQENVKCYSRLSAVIQDAEVNFRWDKTNEISKWSRVKYGTFYNCFAVMACHIGLISIKRINNVHLKDDHEIKREFNGFINRLHNTLNGYETATTKWRLDQLTPLSICEIKLRMWKKFEGVCETRWRRDQLTAEGKNDEIRDVTFSKVGGIGGANTSVIQYKATVNDQVRKEVVFEKEFHAPASSRGDVLEKMFQQGIKVRGGFQKRIEIEMNDFHDSTIKFVREAIYAFQKM